MIATGRSARVSNHAGFDTGYFRPGAAAGWTINLPERFNRRAKVAARFGDEAQD